MIRVVVGSWAELGQQAALVRKAVFVQEQSIPESEEWDDADEVSIHALAWVDDQLTGTGRLLPDGKIGRMAVLRPWRGQGIGAQILCALMQVARDRGHTGLKLSSQQTACGFYSRFGFEPEGPPHHEVGIAHQWMVLNF